MHWPQFGAGALQHQLRHAPLGAEGLLVAVPLGRNQAATILNEAGERGLAAGRRAVLQVNPLRWTTRAKPVNAGLVPSQVNSGAGRTVTWKPALARLLPRAVVAAPSASDSSRTLGPVPAEADVSDGQR